MVFSLLTRVRGVEKTVCRALKPAHPIANSSSNSNQSTNDQARLALYSKYREPGVQACLVRLSNFKVDRVFRFRRQGQKLSQPECKFVTDDQLKEMQDEAWRQAHQNLLQMPPALLPRTEIDCQLESDADLVGFDACDYVFTDITYGVHDRERVIVVRQPDGVLRLANWKERTRANVMYFPRGETGPHIVKPAMFEPQNLDSLLKQIEQKYKLGQTTEAAHMMEYILDRSYIEFEPDDPEFIQVLKTVYDFIIDGRIFDLVSSTRHFGHLIFSLVADSKRLDTIIVHYLTKALDSSDKSTEEDEVRHLLSLAADVIRLHVLLFKGSQDGLCAFLSKSNGLKLVTARDDLTTDNHIQLVRLYCRGADNKTRSVRSTVGRTLDIVVEKLAILEKQKKSRAEC